MEQSVNLPGHAATKTHALERELSATLCDHTLWHTGDEVASSEIAVEPGRDTATH